MSITIIGSLNYDLVTFTDRVPAGGETIQANSFENHLGGKGLNESVACARLSSPSTKVRMVGNIGSDSFGKELKGALVDSGVETTHISTIEGKSSGVAVILVESDGENRILITAGANEDLRPTPEDYTKIFPENSSNHFVLLQNEYPHTLQSVEWLKKNRSSINICYNPSPFKPQLIEQQILSKVDLLIVNEGEALDAARSLLNKDELVEFEKQEDKVKLYSTLAEKLQKIVSQDNAATVIITMGSLGCVFQSRTESGFQKSEKVAKVVDTTGAGDTFFGGVVLRLVEGSTLAEAIKFATKASSLVIQKKGAVESIPKLQEM